MEHGQYKKALEIFERLAKDSHARSDIYIYVLWARFKKGTPKAQSKKDVLELQELFNKIPPEDRHNPHYFLVKGMYHRITGNYKKSATYFKHALSVDPKFLPAKQELMALKKQAESDRKKDRTVLSELTSIFSSNKKSS